MVRLPMLLVPRPCPIHRHPGSSVRIASSLRHTPPPAAPTQTRQPPPIRHAGEIASAATRPEKFPDPLAPPSVVLDGPRLIHAGPCPSMDPRYATPRNTQYFAAAARATPSGPGVPG